MTGPADPRNAIIDYCLRHTDDSITTWAETPWILKVRIQRRGGWPYLGVEGGINVRDHAGCVAEAVAELIRELERQLDNQRPAVVIGRVIAHDTVKVLGPPHVPQNVPPPREFPGKWNPEAFQD